jgi:hypothetical protein
MLNEAFHQLNFQFHILFKRKEEKTAGAMLYWHFGSLEVITCPKGTDAVWELDHKGNVWTKQKLGDNHKMKAS